MNIVAIVGSNRLESFNRKVIMFMKERYKSKVTITPIFMQDLPMYNQDEEVNLPSSISKIKELIKSSDGVMIATPEYNYSIPGSLKNVLDWLSRGESVMNNKKTMTLGASMGQLGTVRAQIHLRQVLNSAGILAQVLPGNEIYIGAAHEKINAKGEITDQATLDILDSSVENFLQWIKEYSVVEN